MGFYHRRTKNGSENRAFVQAGELSVHVGWTDSQPNVKLEGRVTVDSSPVLRTMLLDLLRRQRGGLIVIEVSELSYLDTSGIATLLEALKSARERSVTLRLIGASGRVRMLAEIVELKKIFNAFGSEVVFS